MAGPIENIGKLCSLIFAVILLGILWRCRFCSLNKNDGDDGMSAILRWVFTITTDYIIMSSVLGLQTVEKCLCISTSQHGFCIQYLVYVSTYILATDSSDIEWILFMPIACLAFIISGFTGSV